MLNGDCLGSHTAIGFAIGTLCELDSRPPVKSVKGQRLEIPRGCAVPAVVIELCIAGISMAKIERGFAELSVVAACYI
jgi:hypothetical protein